MIAAVTCMKGDEDIAPFSLAHLRDNGIERIYAAIEPRDNEMKDLLEHVGVRVFEQELCAYFFPRGQVLSINALARRAAEDGARWILPFDADEFPYATNGGSIADALRRCPAKKLYLRRWVHRDWDHRRKREERLHKVAYRWWPEASVAPGNHEINTTPGTFGVLDMREIPYRSFEQFKRKVAAANAEMSPEGREEGSGYHLTRLDGADAGALREAYDEAIALATVYDPIPTQ